MPLIRIKSLPFTQQEVPIPQVLNSLSSAISAETEIESHHIMLTWEYIPAGHYVHSGKAVHHQPINTHPILVDLIAPNFNTEQQIASMLELIANTLAEQVPIAKNNIFINFTPAYSDGVYDCGQVVEWDE
ncbi:hypothetical protein [Photobacterium sanguinicancri]|uniref:4-oxalocrotonate tautomerase domain-containing protein n=1 Tax=Photobacterium sanguinicancri TaxID=875932 RepID=A0ABX4FSA7_9GAMM|nr:hypothetical protein [Photobacterium sanguinicancri]OZS41671.1 hypothetical protein ASV53_22495 [Photobacterium sanguinicancri]